MSSLAFVYLARDAGPTFEDLARDIAGLTRAGDHVVIVEDRGSADTPARIGRFTEQVGWGAGVAVTTILTGTAADGDLGVAANLALDSLRVPGAARDRVVFFCAGARIDGDAFALAREHAEAEALDVMAFPLRQWSHDRGHVIDGPDLAEPDPKGRTGEAILSRALSLRPGLDGMFLRWPVIGRCAEGRSSFGTLHLWWQALHSAERLDVAGQPLGHRAEPAEPDASLFDALTSLISRHNDAASWANAALPRLLEGVTPGAVTGLLAAGPALTKAIGDAGTDPLLRAFADGDLDTARQRLHSLRQSGSTGSIPPEQSLLSTPTAQTRPARFRVCVTGKHSHRQPFAYDALRPLWQDEVTLTDTASEADLIVIAHPHNLSDLSGPLAERADAGTPVALISEEPFWDTLFSPDPLARAVTLPAAHLGTIRAHQVTHHRSAIFDFDRIPYFLLTDPGYIQRYAELFRRNAALSAQDWATAFGDRPHDLTFMAERRPEAFHDMVLPSGDIVGLCAWRTRLAESCTEGRVQRLGASWGHGPSRFDLIDWHGDKIAQIDGQRTRILSGLENTHQPTYLSEKLFDAFACGARPLYYASPGHRVHDLGIPAGAWLNLWGHSVEAAVTAVYSARWDDAFHADYAAAQTRLAALFTDADCIAAERARLGRALTREVARLVQFGAA
ncbi:hypothetical protein [Flavimaricola marinus]|uniref:Uncharacterized protein n=1 Tax=Flavimaricola marinus TaxID=1819565 RepID=A0A238LHW6_9RHOB|nr:hypothetical protein [Flavimaricola marinus]SMY09241.1 hypothetical protein LOM8899_03406 [Flavimaricola marinus]